MGSGMARRLLGAGFPLAIHSRNAEKTAAFQAEGAIAAPSYREAAAHADAVVSMVADDGASRQVWLGDNGALAGAAPGTVLIESSTLTVEWLRALAGHAGARGCQLLDAPVTGTKPHAASGELTFLVGGPAAALEKVRPVLDAMGRAIIHLGPAGSGALLKLINNFLCGVQAASLAEAVALVEKAGLDRRKSFEILTNGAPGSPLVKTLFARMDARDYTPNFKLRLMAKDIAYAIAEGKQHALDPVTAPAALRVFQQAIAHGDGEKDLSAVVEQFRTE